MSGVAENAVYCMDALELLRVMALAADAAAAGGGA